MQEEQDEMEDVKAAILDNLEERGFSDTDEDGLDSLTSDILRFVETPIVPGSLWMHAYGGLYRVIGTGTLEADLTPVVMYQTMTPAQRQDIWVRPLEKFLARFAPCSATDREEPAREADAA
ncbi:MAG: DUF1653 domain-containing protein [Pseudomonadota bacterium]